MCNDLRRVLMRTRGLLRIGAVSLAVLLVLAGSDCLFGQSPTSVALTGKVTSSEEGAMEGVLVTVRRMGATFTVTVVSDQQGRYSFPRTKLEPGQYTIRVRAVGYDLVDPGPVQFTAQITSTIDLKLHKTEDLTTQLTNAEWLMSIPGTQEQKDSILGCTGCHTLERIVKSHHTVDEWVEILKRMSG